MLKIEVEDVAVTMNHPVLHPRRYHRLVVVPPMKAVARP